MIIADGTRLRCLELAGSEGHVAQAWCPLRGLTEASPGTGARRGGGPRMEGGPASKNSSFLLFSPQCFSRRNVLCV